MAASPSSAASIRRCSTMTTSTGGRRAARQFIYLESQYLWLETFSGLDFTRLGWQSHHMRALLTELVAAAERGVTIALVLPDHPNCGRGFTDATVAWLRQNAPK